jgi:hypothetical protein
MFGRPGRPTVKLIVYGTVAAFTEDRIINAGIWECNFAYEEWSVSHVVVML